MNILNNGCFGLPASCKCSMKYRIKKTIDHVNSRAHFEFQFEANIAKVVASENTWLNISFPQEFARAAVLMLTDWKTAL
uniref:Uncharacterized protein n=1 Tax=Ditylenchus dipsaci TaxID=166011 RepID=A0A915CTW5_9BILA